MKTLPVMLDGKKSKIGGISFLLLGLLYTAGMVFPDLVEQNQQMFFVLERAFATGGMGFGVLGVAGKLQKNLDR